jgi:hypothetical protein
MISDNQMDEFFKGRFRDYPSAVPEDMWERIIEKKKRDRMFWLFFFRLFAIVILSLSLVGGYFIFNQKKSVSVIGMDSTKINHTPVTNDTMKASLSDLPIHQDQLQLSQIIKANKKTNQKEKPRINYSEKFGPAKENTKDNTASSKVENTSRVPSTSSESSVPKDPNGAKENKMEKGKDKLDKKAVVIATTPIIKATVPDSLQSKDSKKSETKNKSDNRKWYLDLFASPDYPIISPHNERELSKLSYTIGIKLNRSLGKNFSVKTGIQYSQININARDSFGIIHLMRLDLPVLAGYSMGSGNLKTTINGGVDFNLYTWLHVTNLQDFFKTNTGLSLYLSVNFEERINGRFSLFGEPYYRYQLTSMTVSSVSSMKFIDIVGINIGARYYFKK